MILAKNSGGDIWFLWVCDKIFIESCKVTMAFEINFTESCKVTMTFAKNIIDPCKVTTVIFQNFKALCKCVLTINQVETAKKH